MKSAGLAIEERLRGNLQAIAPQARIVELLDAIEAAPNPHVHDADADESQDSQDEDSESNALDPHVWASPENARAIVAVICEQLQEEDPKNAEVYQTNARRLDEELQALQAKLHEALDPFDSRAFIVFHPAYGYFAREFHLKQLAIELDGKNPKPRDLELLVETAKLDGIQAVLVQPEFNRSSAQVVADQIGARLIEHSPLEKDYFNNLNHLSDAICQSFSTDAAQESRSDEGVESSNAQ